MVVREQNSFGHDTLVFDVAAITAVDSTTIVYPTGASTGGWLPFGVLRYQLKALQWIGNVSALGTNVVCQVNAYNGSVHASNICMTALTLTTSATGNFTCSSTEGLNTATAKEWFDTGEALILRCNMVNGTSVTVAAGSKVYVDIEYQ